MVFVPRFLRPASFLPAALLLVLASGLGCEDKHIGRPCEVAPGADMQPTASSVAYINSAALECVSRICVLPAAGKGATDTGATCSAECDSDGDCDGAEQRNLKDTSDKRCKGSFTCRVATNLGGYACRKLCLCSDFINTSENGSCVKEP